MPAPLDPAALPDNVIALRTLLLHREDEHAAELAAAHNGLKEQVLRNEQLKLRLAKLLRERFGASSEKLRGALEQLELVLGDLEEQVAETASPEACRSIAVWPDRGCWRMCWWRNIVIIVCHEHTDSDGGMELCER
jgi:hypothetical protein